MDARTELDSRVVELKVLADRVQTDAARCASLYLFHLIATDFIIILKPSSSRSTLSLIDLR